MSTDTLRRAAALMRERAGRSTDGPWEVRDGNVEHFFDTIGEHGVVATAHHPDTLHIASWHPAVALAVADWLDEAADFLAAYRGETHAMDNPLAVARAYLGEEATSDA